MSSCHGQSDQDDDRDTGDPSGADDAERRVEDLRQPALCEDERESPASHEQGECRNDRLDAEPGDEDAVYHADRGTAGNRDEDRHCRAVAQIEGEERRRDRHHGTDRQVDPLGADHQGHPEGDDGHGDDLDELEPDVVELGEARREDEVERDQKQQREVDTAVGHPVEDGAGVDRPAARREFT